MPRDLLIGLDIGTSAVKGVLVSAEGGVIGQAKRLTNFIHPKPGYHELDPGEHYRDLCEVLRDCAAMAPKEGRIRGICMAAASGNSLLLDSDNRPLTNIISWMDSRAADQREQILPGFDYDGVLETSGWIWVDSFPLAIFAWYRKYFPELYADARRYCMNSDYLYYLLTGKWGMDPSTATTFYLADQVKSKWHKPYLDALAIDESQISGIFSSGTVLGSLTAQAAADTGLSTEVRAVLGAFDHPCAARGTGNLKPGDVLLSCGTSWVGFYVIESREKAVRATMLVDPFLHPKGPWAGMFSIPYIGQTVEWYAKNRILEQGESTSDLWTIFSGKAAEASPGADGLFLTPFYDLVNNRPMDQVDFPASVKASAIARAVMEGIAFELHNRIEGYAKVGIAAERLTMVGGPSESPVWPQIVSDVTGLAIRISSNGQHAGAIGAAILAGIGTGLYRDEADGWLKLKGTIRELTPDGEKHRTYRRLYGEYRRRSVAKALG